MCIFVFPAPLACHGHLDMYLMQPLNAADSCFSDSNFGPAINTPIQNEEGSACVSSLHPPNLPGSTCYCLPARASLTVPPASWTLQKGHRESFGRRAATSQSACVFWERTPQSEKKSILRGRSIAALPPSPPTYVTYIKHPSKVSPTNTTPPSEQHLEPTFTRGPSRRPIKSRTPTPPANPPFPYRNTKTNTNIRPQRKSTSVLL